MEISPVGLAKRGKKTSKKTSDMVMAKTAGGQVLGVMITENKTKFKLYVDEHGKNIHSESMEMVNTLIKSVELQNYMIDKSEQKGDDADMCTAITELIEDGRIEGRAEGRAEGEELVINLLAKLSSLGKDEDVSKCITDPEYREKMYIAYGFKKKRDNNLM